MSGVTSHITGHKARGAACTAAESTAPSNRC